MILAKRSEEHDSNTRERGAPRFTHNEGGTMSTKRRRIATLVLALFLVFAVAGIALASQTFTAYESCAPGWDAKVRSYATGTVNHYKNGNLTGSWNNYSTPKWRTTYQGDEAQEIIITTTGTLSSQSVACVCLPGHSCASK